ncbi:hypothetical protein [Leptolyngbya sp. FACHB-17]|uniref:hypothetical protein n=1 Tax=unclassified Leptolyngbya TaxID=2650499 RepID=UPI001680E07C|nr:hypothetical protein [Leptolyngbya sp. FACHB-17]MBD2079222.1 hypothetical protein [Leptolyngbya sp. FACHB-17]
MATQNTSNRVRPESLEQGEAVLHGLRTLSNYQPLRREASIVGIEEAYAKMQAAQEKEARLKAESRIALEEARIAEWEFHNCILEAKAAVIAQYGADSPQLQTVGLKRKSTYKRPTRQTKTAELV